MNKIKFRRLRRVLSTNKFHLIMIAIISLLLFTSTGYALLSAVQTIEGSAEIIVGTEYICQSGISATYRFNTSWGSNDGKTHYNSTIVINNESSEDILTWEIVLKGPSDIEIQANANVVIGDNGVVTLTPLSWNSLITAGKSVILEFGAITVESEFDPEYIYVNGCLVYGEGTENPSPDVGDPDIELTGLLITPSTYTMAVGETAPLQAVKTPSDAYAVLSWTSNDENVVRVSDSGVITAVAPGDAIITVSSGDISAQSTITVEEASTPPVTELTAIILNPTQQNLYVGNTSQLTVTMSPADATAELTWSSSNENVAIVSQDGVITAIAPGEATITASSGSISAESVVYVEEENPVLTSLEITPIEHTMTVGDSIALQVTRTPSTATDLLTWSSSDETIAKVGQDGVVVAIGPGKAIITVSSGEISAQSTITVEEKDTSIKALEITPSEYTMNIGDTVTLNVTKTPADSTDILTWSSSNENIATVTQSGVVTALSSGDVVITVSSGEVSAQSSITVEEPTTELTALEITPSEYTMTVDETVVLQVTRTPSNSVAVLTWSSSDETVATVAQDGTVTAVGVGDAIITATNGSVSAQSTITVEEATPPGEFDGVGIEIVKTGNDPWGSFEYGYSMNFSITINNTSGSAINSISFAMNFPDGTVYSLYTSTTSIEENIVTYTYTIENGGSVTIYGQLTMPPNYEINDYLPPSITLVDVK